MILWIDQNLPPALAKWLSNKNETAQHVSSLDMDTASDALIAREAIKAGAVLITKDDDFAFHGPPPSVIIGLGNVTNANLLNVFDKHWAEIKAAIMSGETLVYLRG